MALPIRPRRPVHKELQCISQRLRQFSISQRQCGHKQALANSHANLPDYPYGPSRWYKQSNFGLYGGLKISSGNNVSEKTETKTRRKWRPNVQMKRLYSHALDRYVRVKVATRVLRTIDKSGGLDEYLVGEKPARIKELGMKGWALRCKVMDTAWWKERKIQERDQFGLSPLRKYVADEAIDDDTSGEYFIGMYGEGVQKASTARDQMRATQEELAEAATEYDKDGNIIGQPDLIAYDETEDAADVEATAGEFAEIGRIVEAPEHEYISGKHRRRAIVKERKALAAEARAAHSAAKRASAGTEPDQALRSHDLQQHLAYQKKKDMDAANAILAASDASAVGARATL